MMSRLRWAIALPTIVLVTVVGATVASAQPAPGATGEPPEEALIRAQALYDRATTLYRDKKYAEAIIYYEQALELVQEPDIEYNLAKCHEKIAQYDQAITHFGRYLTLHLQKTGREAPDRADVEATIRDLRRRAKPKPVKLTIVSEPVGANVYLGTREQLVGQTPFEKQLDPGTYDIFVMMEGYEEVSQHIVLERDTPQAFTFKLKRKANVGGLVFDVNVRGARIYVGGQVKGLTPYAEEILVPAGRPQITVEKERYAPVSRIVEVEAGKTIIVREDLHLDDPPYSWRGYMGWTFIGLGLGGIGGGLAIKFVGDGEYFTDEQMYKDLSLYQGLAYGLGGGLLAIGTGLVIWEYLRDAVEPDDLLSPEERAPASPPPVAVGVMPGGGVSVTGQFDF